MNAALTGKGESYSRFIKKLSDKKILVNRKMLSQIARDHTTAFERIVDQVK